jgi:hypothetical protein
MTKYNMYLYDNESMIGKFKTKGDDMEEVYKSFGSKIVRNGFENGYTIPMQILKYQTFIKSINKQKDNCEKIRASDLYMYLSCYCALYKLNGLQNNNDHMFLKVKHR